MGTIQTRLTSDNRQHDEAFRKSRQEIYNYNKRVDESKESVLKFAKKGLGGLSMALGAAGGAMAVFNKLMRSTEQTSDALDRTMFTLKNSVDKFFQSIATGDLSGFIRDLKDIAKYSAAAYNSIDNLGTTKMWKNVRISKYQSEIEKLKTNGGSKEEIDRYQKLIDALQESLTGDTYNAAMDYLGGLIGRRFSNADQANLLKMWEEGTLSEYIKQYEKKHSTTDKRLVGNTWSEWTSWDTEGNEKTYSALKRLLSLREKDGLDVVYNLLGESYQRQEQAEKKKRRNIGSSTSTSTSKSNEREEIEVPFKIISEKADLIAGIYTTISEANKKIADEQLNSLPALEGHIELNEELASLYAKENDLLGEQQEILSLQTSAISSFGDVFSNLGDAFDSTGLKAAGIITQAIATIVEGYTKAMSSWAATASPWAWIGFSAAGLATLTSVISQIHSLSGYANGGIVGGNSFSGDRVMARVNSGEMILNRSQQANLFNMIGGGVSTGGNVKFRIEGDALVGVLNNYNKKTGRVR